MEILLPEELGLCLWGCCVATGSDRSAGTALRGGEARKHQITSRAFGQCASSPGDVIREPCTLQHVVPESPPTLP